MNCPYRMVIIALCNRPSGSGFVVIRQQAKPCFGLWNTGRRPEVYNKKFMKRKSRGGLKKNAGGLSPAGGCLKETLNLFHLSNVKT